jgi:ABC-type uncharacterized transport system involved in gliding motility auxiliary subunit
VKLDRQLKNRLRNQNRIFVFLLLIVMGAFAWLSLHYEYEKDFTQNKRNTPSQASLMLLSTIEEPIFVKAFVSSGNAEVKRNIRKVVDGFHRYKANLDLQIIDPISQPALTRKYNIHADGEVLVEYQDRNEKLRYLDEQSLSNAIHRLVRNSQKWIGFLEGHGERTPYQQGNYDYSTLKLQLEDKGFKTRTVNLANDGKISDNIAVLVISDPQTAFLPGEMQLIQDFVDSGGNLLWTTEPGNKVAMEELSEQLGVEFMPGLVVDMNVQLLGISDPRFVMVSEYPVHPITRNFNTMTLFPTCVGIEFIETEDWEVNILLESMSRSWVEMDEIGVDEVTLDSGVDIPGPITIGVALTRFPQQDSELATDPADELEPSELDDEEQTTSGHEQRIVVIGDADFLADAYIGQGGNLDLAVNIFNWLTRDDSFLAIPARTLIDKQIDLNPIKQIFIGVLFLVIIPVGLLSAGTMVWLRRRKMR